MEDVDPQPAQPGDGRRHDIVVGDGPYDITIAQGKVVESEFASMAVRLDTEGNSVRLRVEDLRTGRVRHLDALELESIVWLGDGHLTQILDPSHERWRG